MSDDTTTLAPPANPTEAATRLSERTSDPGWADRLMKGDPATVREFHALSEIAAGVGIKSVEGQAEAAIQGIVPDEMVYQGRVPTARDLADAVSSLRAVGLSDDAIRQAFTGQKISQREYQLTKDFKAGRHSDPEWVKRFLAGGQAERRGSILMSIILSSEVEV